MSQAVLSEIDTITPTTAKKPRPGRPKKNRDIVPPTIGGCVSEPKDKEDRVEMVCGYPSALTKIIGILNDYGAAEVDVVFTSAGCEFYAKDHTQKVDIYVLLPAKYMTMYYCASTTRVRINQRNFKSVTGSVNKHCSSISMILRERTYRSHVYVVVKENLQDSETTFKFEVIDSQQSALPPLIDDSNYPLTFNINALIFKQQISTMKDAKSITIQKESDSNILLSAERNRDKPNPDIHTTLPSNAILNMKSTILGDDIFTATIQTEHIRRFAVKVIGENVRVCAHAQDKITFATSLKETEGGAMLKIYVEHAVYELPELKNAGY